MNLTFQIKFDEKIYREQAELRFNIALDKNKDTIRNYVIYIIGSFAIGSLLLGLIGNGGALITGSLLIIVSFIYLLIYLNYHYKVRKCWSEFEKQVLSEVDRLKVKSNSIEIQITNDYFIYNDGDIGSTIRWTLFDSFMIIDDFLFFVLNKNDDFSAFYVHESQIGSKNHAELKRFVSSILKPHTHSHKYVKLATSNPELIDN